MAKLLIRVFCQDDHDRERMEFRHASLTYQCPICLCKVSSERVDWSTPTPYRYMTHSEVGDVLAAANDVGALDLVFANDRLLTVEYPRMRDIARD